MRELFIYYRIPADAVPRALDAARSMQATLRQRHPGLTARLLRRPREEHGLQTWMEFYAFEAAGEPPGVTREIEAEIAAAAALSLSTFVAGERHTEVFVPCAS